MYEGTFDLSILEKTEKNDFIKKLKMGNAGNLSVHQGSRRLVSEFEKQVNKTLSIKEDLAKMDTDSEIKDESSSEQSDNQIDQLEKAEQTLKKRLQYLSKRAKLSAEEKKLKQALQNILNTKEYFSQVVLVQDQPNFQKKYEQSLSIMLASATTKQILAFYFITRQLYQKTEYKKLDFSEYFNKFGGNFVQAKNYRLAEESLQQSLKILENQPNTNKQKANVVNNYGILLKKQNKMQSALECYQMSLKIYEQNDGSRTLEYGKVLYNMALILDKMGEKQKSLQKLYESLEINQKICGSMGLECADICHKIGAALMERGKSDKAISYLRRCSLILKWFELTKNKCFEINKHYLENAIKGKSS